ncbi:hypothetical protein HMPREF2531_05107 [Bacteroides intestinalis]|uniref:Uncharacterized protein n=2 Tax=Bacteroides TaxID=816 RepID=A0A139KNP6_9BACE|nr:hypothetical protein BACCELL_00893 [Bacteroides cellulosilyticus DSM 14838]KXT40809.1 hypothetical protein HMPREF2531_05107 [Bacteroides intestinalis]
MHFFIQVFEETIDCFTVALMQATEIGKGEYGTQSGQAFFFQMFPDGIARKEENRLGVVDDMMYIIRIKILKNGNNDSSVSDGGHISDAPTGIVLTDNSNFVAPAQAAMFE